MTALLKSNIDLTRNGLELLSDRKGVYGVGFLDPPEHGTGEIVFRPDRVTLPRNYPAILTQRRSFPQ